MNPKPTAVFRHYYSEHHRGREVVTFAAVFMPRDERPIAEPLCIGSRLYASTLEGNDIYRWAIVQRWALPVAPPDGTVRLLESNDVDFTGQSERRKFDQDVIDQKIATLAVPLLNIRSTMDLERQIIEPLVAFPFAPPLAGPGASELRSQVGG